jgi:putative nucleotidyltransferase with HDIG domain
MKSMVEKVLFQALDQDTIIHSLNVERIALQISSTMNLDSIATLKLSVAAHYHDVGKSFIPDEILQKPGKLTEKEYELIKKHTDKGYAILRNVFSEEVSKFVLYHHENYDGSGYHRLKGNDIPIESCILRVADVYDALTSERPYKKAWSHDDVMEYLESESGLLFHPEVVAALEFTFQQNIA